MLTKAAKHFISEIPDIIIISCIFWFVYKARPLQLIYTIRYVNEIPIFYVSKYVKNKSRKIMAYFIEENGAVVIFVLAIILQLRDSIARLSLISPLITTYTSI